MYYNDGVQNLDRQWIVGLDIFRVLAAFSVFLFHSEMHIGCYYGILNNFIHMGAIFMTGFFLLSGYALYISYGSKSLIKIDNIKIFYAKRIVGIGPFYYFIALIYILFMGNESFADNLILFPVELLGIQSAFSGLFNVTHNSGTWFISCLVILYIVYPYLQEVIKQISNKIRILLILLCSFILLLAPFIVYRFSTSSIYANPFFRGLEFLIGIILASIKQDVETNRYFKILFHRITFFVESLILVICVSFAVKIGIGINDYMLYSWIALPMFMLMVITLSGIRSEKLENCKFLRYLSSVSYGFFLAQFFTWRIIKWIFEYVEPWGNVIKISVSFLLNLIIAMLLHEFVEKPLTKILEKLLLKKNIVKSF